MSLILLVDDDDLILNVLKSYLQTDGHEILTASETTKAAGLVQSVDLGLVICDVRIAPLTGIDLLRQIRQDKPNLPVIMTTTFGEFRVEKEAAKFGAFGCLSKPFTQEEVRELVQRALSIRPAGTANTQEKRG